MTVRSSPDWSYHETVRCGQTTCARGIVWADIVAEIERDEQQRQIARENEGRFWST